MPPVTLCRRRAGSLKPIATLLTNHRGLLQLFGGRNALYEGKRGANQVRLAEKIETLHLALASKSRTCPSSVPMTVTPGISR